MPRNGSGAYSLPAAYLATTGNTIQATQHNIPLTDIAADLNAARPVSAGGTGATTAAAARTNLGLSALATATPPAGLIVGTTDTQTLSNKTFADGSDVTKKLALVLSGFTTGTTRTLTLPDQNVTISPYGASLIDDASASAARTTLGLAAVAASGLASDVAGLATVATSGSYNDLSNKPAVPDVLGTIAGSGPAAVGTYAFLRHSSSSVTGGSSYSGGLFYSDISGNTGGGSVPGTWLALGTTTGPNGVTLFKRTS